MDTHFEKK